MIQAVSPAAVCLLQQQVMQGWQHVNSGEARGGGAQSNRSLQPQVLLGVMWLSGELPEYQAWAVVAWLKAGRQVGKLLAMALVGMLVTAQLAKLIQH